MSSLLASKTGRRLPALALWFVALGAGFDAVALAQSALGVIEQAIVGGHETRADVPSATARIGDCDATLVAPDLLLTAAHCIERSVPESAWFGASEEEAWLMVSIAACAAHPDYPRGEGSDIAYCTLFEHVSEVEPARLDSGCGLDGARLEGAALLLRGHGYVTAAHQEARIEREVAVWINAVQAAGRELIVGDRDHGGCNGDSGGSAFGASAAGGLVLAGVISRRGPSADGSVPENCASTTIVTRVAPHVAWLAQATGGVVGNACTTPASRPDNSPQDGLFTEAPTHVADASTTMPTNSAPYVPPAANAGCSLAPTNLHDASFRPWLWLALLALAGRNVPRPRRDSMLEQAPKNGPVHRAPSYLGSLTAGLLLLACANGRLQRRL